MSAPLILSRARIEAALPDESALIAAIEQGFVDYSQSKVDVPPVGELMLPDHDGEMHIKYGAIRGDWCHVVKIASGFYRNPGLGLPSSDGLMLVFSQRTGTLLAILLDEGCLTDVRTAVAGAVAARHLAPPDVRRIGIVGTGVQARLQAHWLKAVTPARALSLWGRTPDQVDACRHALEADGFDVMIAGSADAVVAASDLVVTTTPATAPLIHADALHPGLHITAMGSDTPHKQELDVAVLARADLVVADSREQCRTRGEIAQALRAGAIEADDVIELGELIGRSAPRRRPEDITVADLTGVAVQDIQIAKAVLHTIAPELAA